MAGRIRREDVDAVRERARIEEIVGERVRLKPAGSGSLKGLCPFHDERTPSFHVRPAVGLWHCFGCGEGGDVISFVQKIDALGFAEAVEYLAGRTGVDLRYEQGDAPRGPTASTRQRLLEAHRVAGAYYAEQLLGAEAAIARSFLTERGFDRQVAEIYGIGYAPKGWDNLTRYLRGRGFTEAELTASGLASAGNRGNYDRFRGRLMWPIRDLTGDTVGFGARRLHEDDQGPKYLNTPETAIYKKANLLYGADLAKREIGRRHEVVIVEGYTDVMAAHLAGVPTAVATCGTAFAADHIRIVRRLLGDSADPASGVLLSGGQAHGGQVIFTFDGDEAGKKAALRAFAEDQRFYSQTFVAIAADGMDPCELRQRRGDAAVRALIQAKVPLFRFAITAALDQVDVDSAEGRVRGLELAAPVVARIRDRALRAEYARQLSGWLGMEEHTVRRAVADAGRVRSREGAPAGEASGRYANRPATSDPVVRMERQALEAILQYPSLAAGVVENLPPDVFTVPAYRAVFDVVRSVGMAGVESAHWLEQVREAAAAPVAGVVTELAVSPLPISPADHGDRLDPIEDYVKGVLSTVQEVALTRQIADCRARLQRLDQSVDPQAYQDSFAELLSLEASRRALRQDV